MNPLLLAAILVSPSPQPTLPTDFDAFCAGEHAGAYEGTVTGPKIGVVIVCRRAEFIFTKGAIPKRVEHWKGAPL